MKILITGATGFIGSHLIEQLLAKGHAVKALARQSSDVSRLKSLGVEIIYGDIRDISIVEKAVDRCEIVYHLAARTSRHRSQSRQEDHLVNVEGTRNLANASIKADVKRFVFASSCGIYGFIKHPSINEQTKPNPNTPYRESKLLAEKLLLFFHKREGLPVVIARISSVYGPRSHNWIGLLRAIKSKWFRIIGSGENQNQMGYVTDVADGLHLCGKTPGIEGQSYIISGKEPIKLKQLVNIIAEELSVPVSSTRLPELPFRTYRDLSGFMYKYLGFELPRAHAYELFLMDRIFDISKAKKELGYDPKVSMKEGIQETFKWYHQNGYIS